MFFVKQAKECHANLLLLPEYAGMEIAWLYKGPLSHQWEKLQDYLADYIEFFGKIAKEHDLYIQSGTLAVKLASGKFNNRAYFFSPNGHYDYQDKMIITASESEFPSLVHLLAYKNKVKIIFVPSYTNSQYGFYRVHLSCRARAIEYQCYVVHACAHDKVDTCEFLDATAVGSAGIFSPADDGFPENGVLALGDAAMSNQLIGTTLSLEKLDHVRSNGEVRNFKDQALLENIYTNVTFQTVNF